MGIAVGIGTAYGGLISAPSPLQAMQPLMSALNANAANINIVGTGDSIALTTATSYYEKWWTLLSAVWTQYTFKVAKWNDGLGSYDAPTTITTGLGSFTATFYNASVTGTNSHYLLCDKRAAAITAPAPSMVLCNYGANHSTTLTVGPTRYFTDWIGIVRELLPTAQLLIVGQPPNRDSNVQAADMAAARAVAQLAGVAYVPIYEKFLADGKPAGYYVDSVHPSSTGGDVGAAVLNGYSTLKAGLNSLPTNAFFVSRGDIFAFDKTPTGWVGSNCTMAATTTAGEFETGGQALKLTPTTAAAATAYKPVLTGSGLDPYRGAVLTWLVRKRGFAASDSFCGYMQVNTDAGAIEVISTGDILFGTNFYWQSISFVVPVAATFLRTYLYASNSATAGTLCIDRSYLVPGIVPGF
jgi:hypothetical protein